MGLPVKAVMADNAVVWDLEALFNCSRKIDPIWPG